MDDTITPTNNAPRLLSNLIWAKGSIKGGTEAIANYESLQTLKQKGRRVKCPSKVCLNHMQDL